MDLNIRELGLSGDGETNLMGIDELRHSSNNILFKSDSAYKSTLLNSKEEQINQNKEIINEEIYENDNNKKIIINNNDNIIYRNPIKDLPKYGKNSNSKSLSSNIISGNNSNSYDTNNSNNFLYSSPQKARGLSHKEKIMLLLSQEKTKVNKKEVSYFALKKDLPKEDSKKERTDRNGTIINKKNKKKVKVTFNDEINKNKLVTEIKIESYKKYNLISGMPKEDYYLGVNKKAVCKCCSIY